jgi:transposase
VQEYYAKYDEIIKNGENEFKADLKIKKIYNGEDMKLLRRMKEYKKEHLRFIADFNVLFDNNLAERYLRMIKAKSKISGCFRSNKGGEVFASIKSYTSTLHKNNQNLFQGISLAFNNNPVII